MDVVWVTVGQVNVLGGGGDDDDDVDGMMVHVN